MKYFEQLGARIERDWRDANHDDGALPAVAERALREAPPHEHVRPDEIVRWALSADALPHQHDLEASFGQPPLTVYRGRRFVVTALFWVDGTTSIHQHAFSGAFAVLAGSSIHTRWDFAEKRAFGPRFLLGALAPRAIELLRVGDVRPIPGGRANIHSLFHLERPSVTVLVRNSTDARVEPQYAYLRPGVAHDPFFKDPSQTRALQLLRMLHEVKHPDVLALTGELLDRADMETTFHVLLDAFGRVPGRREFAALLARAGARHGEDAARALQPAFEEHRRLIDVSTLRGRVTDPALRYFLALLMTAPDRAAVLALMAAREPGRDPVELVLERVGALAAQRYTVHAGEVPFEVNALGMPLDALGLRVLGALLRGDEQPGQIAERLAREPASAKGQSPEGASSEGAGAKDASGEVAQRVRALRALRLLAPLFAA